MNIRIENQDLSFIHCELFAKEQNIDNIFSRKNNKTVYETITEVKSNGKKNWYARLKHDIDKSYNQYKDYPLGEFLLNLKKNGNDFYKCFLNNYGDELFCSFKITDSKILPLKGLYAYCMDNDLKYIGLTTDSYYKRINGGYAKISPKKCYVDGRITECRLNSYINPFIHRISFYIYPMLDNKQIAILEEKLIKKYNPEWNIKSRSN